MRKGHWESFSMAASFTVREIVPSQLYRLRLGNNPVPEIFVEGLGSEHIDGDPQQIPQSVPDLADVEDRCLRNRVYQYVKATLFRVFPRKDRAKNTRVARTGRFHDAANLVSMFLMVSFREILALHDHGRSIGRPDSPSAPPEQPQISTW